MYVPFDIYGLQGHLVIFVIIRSVPALDEQVCVEMDLLILIVYVVDRKRELTRSCRIRVEDVIAEFCFYLAVRCGTGNGSESEVLFTHHYYGLGVQRIVYVNKSCALLEHRIIRFVFRIEHR